MGIEAKISQLITFGGRIGMPVRFLRYVLQNYDFVVEDDDRDETNILLNEVQLMTGTADGLRGIERFEPASDTIDTIYHESTHAYFDLRGEASDEPIAGLLSRAARHYRGADLSPPEQTPDLPVTDVAPGDIPRLVDEAAGEYVGHRARIWWHARQLLNIASLPLLRNGQPNTEENALRAVRWARGSYNRGTAQRVFGYTEVGLIWRDARWTRRQIMPGLKRYLDRQLLEDKIPDNFHSVEAFRTVLQELSVQWRWHRGEAWRDR